MKRIHKFAAVGVSMAAFALISAALAVGAPRAASGVYRAGVTAGSASSLPNTNIKGHPAHFKPKRLHATAWWPHSEPPCVPTYFSFTIKNHESKNEKVKFTGTLNFTPFSVLVLADTEEGICITKGYHGTLTGKLHDGKKLKVIF